MFISKYTCDSLNLLNSDESNNLSDDCSYSRDDRSYLNDGCNYISDDCSYSYYHSK